LNTAILLGWNADGELEVELGEGRQETRQRLEDSELLI
jgi:hypothetical protein